MNTDTGEKHNEEYEENRIPAIYFVQTHKTSPKLESSFACS